MFLFYLDLNCFENLNIFCSPIFIYFFSTLKIIYGLIFWFVFIYNKITCTSCEWHFQRTVNIWKQFTKIKNTKVTKVFKKFSTTYTIIYRTCISTCDFTCKLIISNWSIHNKHVISFTKSNLFCQNRFSSYQNYTYFLRYLVDLACGYCFA